MLDQLQKLMGEAVAHKDVFAAVVRAVELVEERDRLRAEFARLGEAVAAAGFAVLRSADKWTLHDVTEKGKEDERRELATATRLVELEVENEGLKARLKEAEDRAGVLQTGLEGLRASYAEVERKRWDAERKAGRLAADLSDLNARHDETVRRLDHARDCLRALGVTDPHQASISGCKVVFEQHRDSLSQALLIQAGFNGLDVHPGKDTLAARVAQLRERALAAEARADEAEKALAYEKSANAQTVNRLAQEVEDWAANAGYVLHSVLPAWAAPRVSDWNSAPDKRRALVAGVGNLANGVNVTSGALRRVKDRLEALGWDGDAAPADHRKTWELVRDALATYRGDVK